MKYYPGYNSEANTQRRIDKQRELNSDPIYRANQYRRQYEYEAKCNPESKSYDPLVALFGISLIK